MADCASAVCNATKLAGGTDRDVQQCHSVSYLVAILEGYLPLDQRKLLPE
jgi:hypothetical protein